jgi:hypothetical protein
MSLEWRAKRGVRVSGTWAIRKRHHRWVLTDNGRIAGHYDSLDDAKDAASNPVGGGRMLLILSLLLAGGVATYYLTRPKTVASTVPKLPPSVTV